MRLRSEIGRIYDYFARFRFLRHGHNHGTAP
jgi:hypothetical protein